MSDKEVLEDVESSLAGMTANRAVEKLAEVIAVARRGHSWEWVAKWLYAKGVKSQRGNAPMSPETLSNYFSLARKKGLVDEERVDKLVKVLDAKVRVETLKKIGTEDALQMLFQSKADTAKKTELPRLETDRHIAEVGQAAKELKSVDAQIHGKLPEATFDDYKEAIAANLAKAIGEQKPFLVVAGKRCLVPASLQRKVHNGLITTMEEIKAALAN